MFTQLSATFTKFLRLRGQIRVTESGYATSAGIARARCHREQRLALPLIEGGTYRLDGSHLVEARHLARRVASAVVPQPVLVPVGVEDDGASPELCLEAVRVQLACCWPTCGELRVLLASTTASGIPSAPHNT